MHQTQPKARNVSFIAKNVGTLLGFYVPYGAKNIYTGFYCCQILHQMISVINTCSIRGGTSPTSSEICCIPDIKAGLALASGLCCGLFGGCKQRTKAADKTDGVREIRSITHNKTQVKPRRNKSMKR